MEQDLYPSQVIEINNPWAYLWSGERRKKNTQYIILLNESSTTPNNYIKVSVT